MSAAVLGFALGAVLVGGAVGFGWWISWGWSRHTIALAWLVLESEAPPTTREKAHEILTDELMTWSNAPAVRREIRELRERLEEL